MKKIYKKIGIWGFGIVGKSAAHFLIKKNLLLSIMDKKLPTQQDLLFFKKKSIPFYLQSPTITHQFLKQNNYILPSPGIDLYAYQAYKKKWLSELDLFFKEYNGTIISITGTIGKTTVTTILAQALEHINKNVFIGGNIGTGMLSAFDNDINYDFALLEVSSFQLALCSKFAPQLAIWTNFFPNHLDRHKTKINYFKAKKKCLDYQNEDQLALLPLEIINEIIQAPPKSSCHFFSYYPPTSTQCNMLRNNDSIFFIDKNRLIRYYKQKTFLIFELQNTLPPTVFLENVIIVYSALYLLNMPLPNINLHNSPAITIEHRLEHVATVNALTFYNDSKATIPFPTLAAVKKINTQPLYLIIGGLSKGVNRESFIQQLKEHVTKLYCFGYEANQLAKFAQKYSIPHKKRHSLDEIFKTLMKEIKKEGTILFSPAGSSFDLFKNYQERGNHFKQLVKKYIQKKNCDKN
jgi:UDP-N-acetylmuramoylalanine--D-glutamate ligase